jgi:predicted signal transduction protein with EAL and GGDEF domain
VRASPRRRVSWTASRSPPPSASGPHMQAMGPADIETLCERADKALYQAKALGRNRVESAVDDLVPLVPSALVEADTTTATA